MYYYAGQTLIETHNGSEQVIKQHLWGLQYIDELVQIAVNDDPADAGEDDCESVYYACHNANFNVLGVVDDTGDLVERYEYTPYGERVVFVSSGTGDADTSAPALESARVVTAGSVRQPYGLCEVGHQGLIHDKETALIYNRARMHHPRLGRFMQRDPLGYVDGMGLYEYVASQPTAANDAYGLKVEHHSFTWDHPCIRPWCSLLNLLRTRVPKLFRNTYGITSLLRSGEVHLNSGDQFLYTPSTAVSGPSITVDERVFPTERLVHVKQPPGGGYFLPERRIVIKNMSGANFVEGTRKVLHETWHAYYDRVIIKKCPKVKAYLKTRCIDFGRSIESIRKSKGKTRAELQMIVLDEALANSLENWWAKHLLRYMGPKNPPPTKQYYDAILQDLDQRYPGYVPKDYSLNGKTDHPTVENETVPSDDDMRVGQFISRYGCNENTDPADIVKAKWHELDNMARKWGLIVPPKK